MWVYKGESLGHRLQLSPNLGFWLDYWLFLHSDETHPIWCARPLGLKAIAGSALNSNSLGEGVVREQLKQELQDLIKCKSYVEILPKIPSYEITVNDKRWKEGDKWWLWFAEVMEKVNTEDLIESLANALAKALSHKDLKEATFLTRKLASELGGENWSMRQLFLEVKERICDSGLYDNKDLDEATGKRGQVLNCEFHVFCYQHDLDDSSKEELMSLG